MKEEKKTYICICGREFDTSQKINAHKARCKQWYLYRDGNLEKWNKETEKRIKVFKNTFEDKKAAKQKHANDLWLQDKHTCEHCGKIMTERFGSGRFCSRRCANTRKRPPKTKEKISKSVNKYFENNLKNTGQKVILSEKYVQYLEKQKMNYDNSFVKTPTGYLDITNKELEEYRKTQTVCEICGKPEVATNKHGKIQNLAADHNHDTNRFRGLLCAHCNRNLAWAEKHLFGILDYIEKDINKI